jgi:hypothetical protein
MPKIFAVALACLALAACGHRDRSPAAAKNVVVAAKAQTAIGLSRADVTKLLGTPYYGDDLEWHYFSTDPASGKEITCFIYFKADTGIVRDVGCQG